MLLRFIILFLLAGLYSLQAKTPDLDHQKNVEFRKNCERVRKYNVRGRFDVDCYHNYHHYNSTAHEEHYEFFRAQHYGKVRLGSFNLWHPGTSKSGLKDYKLLAKVVDQWDVLAAQELLPVVGEDLRHNEDVTSFLREGPELLRELKQSLSSSTGEQRVELKARIQKLESDLRQAPKLYRSPGYLKLLEELRKIDPSWSLMLAPRGEAAESFHVQELTGFYYRSSRVEPIVNRYCEDFPERSRNGRPYACIPSFHSAFFGKNVAQAFSRRPFMASFRSAQFDFSLLTSHVIFTSPRGDEEQMSAIMRAAFERPTYENLGEGFNLQTYARFAEVKLTLDFMQKYNQRYSDSHLIFAGDMNIEASNSFWPNVLNSLDGGELFIEQMTSMSQLRFRAGNEPTHGLASNYDHFIFSPKLTPECDGEGAKTFNFYQEWTAEWIDREYMIRKGPVKTSDYDLRYGAQEKIRKKVQAYTAQLKKRLTVRDNQIVWDDHRFEQRLKIYEDRIFFDQLMNRTYYRVFFELLSDHFPISMDCRNIR